MSNGKVQWVTVGADGSRFTGTWDAALEQSAWLERQDIGWQVHSIGLIPEARESMPQISIRRANLEVRAMAKAAQS